MSRSGTFHTLISTLLLALFGGAVAAPAAQPAIRLTDPARSSFETAQESVALTGRVTTDHPVGSVSWVNQFGRRGSGSWKEGAHGESTWTIRDVALREGVNLIAVVVTDISNRSATVHLAVNRRQEVVTEPRQPLRIATGVYQGRPIVYQVWNGHAVVDGDILLDLSAVANQKFESPAATASKVIPEGIALSHTAQLWPKSGSTVSVPYIVTGSGSTTILTSALSAFNAAFMGVIQFNPCSAPPNTSCGLANYVNITANPGGSGEGYSQVGMVGGPQVLVCGDACTITTWLHEMGHTVGLLHEHQRPDRTNYIVLNLTNADLPNVPGNFTLFTYDSQSIGLYDYASVMEYPAFSLSKAGRPVVESTPAGIPLSNNSGYSAGDVDQVQRLYGATPAAVTVTTNPAGLQIIVDGVTYTAPYSFTPLLNSAHTLALPADPQLTSPADGSTYAFGNWNDLGASSHTIFVTPGAGTLVSPANKPAVTVYQANYIRLQPFVTPAANPTGSGSVHVSPALIAEFSGTFFADRTLVQLTFAKSAGYDFYHWDNLGYPASDTTHSFYIQAPTTSAPAVSLATSTPVTIVGETITGPNTWNPPLAGHVDTIFTLLPTGFSPNEGWAANSSHMVSVDQTQSPVTTNVYYNWNSWSDSGAISHTITQPNSGAQTITASFTPFYASYTVPPPLGSTNASCAGGVATSPPGVSYPVNTAFGFYGDGTSVMSTASANPQFPAMVFSGWTGSLAGVTNPQTIAVHDQFVPTANFNVVAAPLAITSLAPASAVVSATAALDVTVHGTGFTPTGTFAYWNNFGNFRPNTFVSSTQLTLHLQSGDLATAGGQDVIIGNYTTSSNQTCGVIVETGYTIAPTGRGKGVTTVTLTPASLTFANTQVGFTSAAQTVTLKNTGTQLLTLGAIAPQGFASTSYVLSANTCGSTLAAATSCTFNMAFAPTIAGALAGTLAATDNATASPQTVALHGTGTAPKVTLTPATLTFPSTAVGNTSAGQTVTLKNTGTAALTITSITLIGTNPTSFVVTGNTCGSSLAVNTTCTVTVASMPAKTGALSAFLAVTDNAAGSPQKVTLHGTGI